MTGVDLTAAERRIFAALREADGVASHERLMAALFEGRVQLPSDHGEIKVYVHRLRLKGLEIVNVRGIGYALAPCSRCPTCGQTLERAR